jgi:hypothetical protein
MADLVKPDPTREGENNLDDDELRILYEAGVLQGSMKAIKRRKPNHIVFAESPEEGAWWSCSSVLFGVYISC